MLFSQILFFIAIGILVLLAITQIFNAVTKASYERDKRNEAEKIRIHQESLKQQAEIEAQERLKKEEERSKMTLPKYLDMTQRYILKYIYEDVDVAGVSYQNIDYDKITPGMHIMLYQESFNEYDQNAVSLNAHGIDGILGYLYKGKLQDMANNFMERDGRVDAKVTYVSKEEQKIKIVLGFYVENLNDYQSCVDSPFARKTFRLTGNTNKEMQETISLCHEEEFVYADWDFEKERYCASCYDTIGYFPKSANDWADLEDDNVKIFIEEIEENENDKYVVSVIAFKQNLQ